MQPLIEAYLVDLKLYHRSPVTIKTVGGILSKFAGDKDLLKVNTTDIKMWLGTLDKVSVQTQAKYIQHVSIFYNHLIEENIYTEKNPCKKILKELQKAPTNPINITNILSVDDIRKIVLKASNPRDRSMLLLFYKTGIRLHELQQLRMEDINLEEKTATIQKRKGGKKGIVIFDDECKRWLKAYFVIKQDTGNPFKVTFRAIQQTVKKIGKRAGIENLKPHDFRHAFTSHLQEARCHPEVIRVLRGDAKGDMVSYYTHFSDAKNREEYENCIPKLGV